jgi:hypothetical protein
MAELTAGGLGFRWSTMTTAERRDFGISMVASAAGGLLMGELISWFEGMASVELSPGNILLALSPLLPGLVAVWFWWRFCTRQDELFRRMHAFSVRIALNATFAFVAVVGLLEHMLRIDLLPMSWAALVTVIGGALGWVIAARRYV